MAISVTGSCSDGMAFGPGTAAVPALGAAAPGGEVAGAAEGETMSSARADADEPRIKRAAETVDLAIERRVFMSLVVGEGWTSSCCWPWRIREHSRSPSTEDPRSYRPP